MAKRRRERDDAAPPDPAWPAKQQKYNYAHAESRERKEANDEWLRQGRKVSELCKSFGQLSVRSSLLGLPAEIRNKIYRMMFEENDNTITVKSCTFPEPPLLRVSKQVRMEAGSIFYSECTVKIEDNWTYGAGIVCEYKRKNVFIEFQVNIRLVETNNVSPNWQDFLVGLRRFHAGYVVMVEEGESNQGQGGSGQTSQGTNVQVGRPLRRFTCALVKAMVSEAMASQDLPWSRVKSILEKYHAALIAADPLWA